MKPRKEFDPEIGERIYVRLWKGERLRDILRSDKAFPSRMVLARWRRENAEFDGMLRFVFGGWRKKRPKLTRCKLTPALSEAIFEGLVTGGSLRSLARRPDMPCARTLYSWVARKPDFAEMVAQACAWRDDWYDEEIRIIEDRMDWTSMRELRRRTAPLVKQQTRLRKRPGWKRRREAPRRPTLG